MLVYFCLALHLNQGIKYLVGKEWHVNCACGMCGRSGYETTVHVLECVIYVGYIYVICRLRVGPYGEKL